MTDSRDFDLELDMLSAYLDGELTEQRRVEITRHLDLCGPCVGAYGFETELRKVIANRAVTASSVVAASATARSGIFIWVPVTRIATAAAVHPNGATSARIPSSRRSASRRVGNQLAYAVSNVPTGQNASMNLPST